MRVSQQGGSVQSSKCALAYPGPGPGSVGGTGVLERMAKVGSHGDHQGLSWR